MIDLLPTHQIQRWKMDMLRYDFHVIHCPEMMLCECNLLSRYNSYADKLRKEEKQEVRLRDEWIKGKLSAGMSPNKGARALAAKDPEDRFTGSSGDKLRSPKAAGHAEQKVDKWWSNSAVY
jgi:hypothetical protein